jgi:hypothetical protein
LVSTDVTTTGAAGATPMPAVVVPPSLRGGTVRLAPIAAPHHGTGLPVDVRPWASDLTGTSAPRTGAALRTRPADAFAGGAAGTAGYAERTTSSTPGAQPPRDPLS